MAEGTQQQHLERSFTSHPSGKVLGCQVSQDPRTQVLHRSSMCLPAATHTGKGAAPRCKTTAFGDRGCCFGGITEVQDRP